MILLVFSCILFLYYAKYLLSAIKGWKSLEKVDPNTKTRNIGVSIIVPVRNEEDKITLQLKTLLPQINASRDQIIYVNDHSSDKSTEIIANAIQNHNGALLINLDDTSTGKKSAIEKGISLAKNDWIITTDADCIYGANWLSQMKNYLANTSAVLCFGPVTLGTNNSILGKLQSLEFAGLMSLSAGRLQVGLPNSCSGANLAYRKDAFEQVKGFEGNKDYASGDDEFLMHKIIQVDPKAVEFIPNSNTIVVTDAATSLKQFFNQRLRWASKGNGYKIKRLKWEQMVMGLYFLAFWFNFAFALQGNSLAEYGVAILFIGKLILDYMLLHQSAYFFKVDHLMSYLPLAQAFQFTYVPIVAITSIFSKGKWKGRTI